MRVKINSLDSLGASIELALRQCQPYPGDSSLAMFDGGAEVGALDSGGGS